MAAMTVEHDADDDSQGARDEPENAAIEQPGAKAGECARRGEHKPPTAG